MDKNVRPGKLSKEAEPTPSTSKQKTRGRKRKRQESESSSDPENVLPENTLEFEKSLHSAAIKNNLDEAGVKKILKKVVTNDHVLALVKLREEEENAVGEKKDPQPKITRAKAKELMRVSPKSAPWNLELTPIKHIPVKTRPEVKALIAQELPEDEDDDEYKPTADDVPSDDDHTLESCSDLDSQPRTPATPNTSTIVSPMVVKDGPFKVPNNISSTRRKLIIDEEEATIALRTRSKVSLASTSIEHIESSFVPPDEVPTPVDEIWTQFLEECMNPAEVSRNEDDDDADPEYNVANDLDANDEDDPLDNLIKISKKELNDLVTELFNIMPESTADDELAANLAKNVLTDTPGNDLPSRWDGKTEPVSDGETEVCAEKISQQKRDSNTRFSIGKSEPEDPEFDETERAAEKAREILNAKKVAPKPSKPTTIKISLQEKSMSVRPGVERGEPPPALRRLQTEGSTPVLITLDSSTKVTAAQISILQQQLRQHIQLCATNFMQLCVHPVHWGHAHTYKKYAEQFNEMLDSNPQSVVNVCNLKPALELMKSWEVTVSEDNADNNQMVTFIQKELERSRHRSNQNSLYKGEFPELFMQVIANSSVFLYPYLLPAMPYRGERTNRFGYRWSEDEYIVLGLDQFREYIRNNPSLFRRPRGVGPDRTRWGLNITCSLVCKHMLPWLSPKHLQAHIFRARKEKARDNPIAKYFETGEVTPVQHKLLPFNPALTLYEQPEHEMPRIWVRYLAKTSKRFRNFLYQRTNSGRPPEGVPITESIQQATKTPLPIDFTKSIKYNRIHKDQNDVEPTINNTITISNNIQNNVMTDPSSNAGRILVVDNGKVVGNLIPVNTTNVINHNNKTPITNNQATLNTISNTLTQPICCTMAPNMYSVVQTNAGAYLVPLNIVQSTNTVNSTVTPITSVRQDIGTEKRQDATSKNVPETKKSSILDEINKRTEELKQHCQCCLLLRKICKEKQCLITEFFKAKRKEENVCECSNKKYPRISKRLKLLVNNYRNRVITEYSKLEDMLKECVKEKDSNECQSETESDDGYSLEDIAYVTNYQVRLTLRGALVRNVYTKNKINTAFKKFNPKTDDPETLALHLDSILGADLVDLYKEFIGFLTAEQADNMDRFKDYFINNCVRDLMKKIEAKVTNKEERLPILKNLKQLFADKVSTSCEICASILVTIMQQPKLAKYVFSLFPHRSKKKKDDKCEQQTLPPENPTQPEPQPLPNQNQIEFASVQCQDADDDEIENNLTICDEESAVMGDYEADNSGSDEESVNNSTLSPHKMPLPIPMKTDAQTDTISTELTISKIEIERCPSDCTDEMSPLVMSEDEPVKTEASEWSREEDKTILEVIIQNIAPKERKDKTVLEAIEEKNVYQLLNENLPHKSLDEVKGRVMYLLEILVLNTEFQ